MESFYKPEEIAASEPEVISPNKSQTNAINLINKFHWNTIHTCKNRHFIATIFLIVFVSLSTSIQLFGTDNIRRGERPYINLAEVPANAYEQETFRIKLTPEGAAIVDDAILNRSNINGATPIGIQELDSLNTIFGITSYEKSIQNLYDSSSRSIQIIDRHNSWGFNQWFDLHIDQEVDIVEIVKQYSKLPIVLIAEPVYKKVFHFDEALMQHEIDESFEKEQRSLNTWVPNDPFFETQWNLNNTGQVNGTAGADINPTEAWEIEKGNPAVIVAIIDGGIYHMHNDLAGNMWDQIGYNFVNNSNVIIPHNHGTHVAGIVAAVSNNEAGISGIAGGSGVNDGIRLMSCQVFTQTSLGGFHTAFLWAADNGAAIANNSWTYSTPNIYEYVTLDAIDYFNSHAGGDVMEGGLVIFSAGNRNSQDNYYPGCYSGTVAVAATTNKDEKASYSNYADWIDISAPGGETTQVWERGIRSTIVNNNYAFYQGTSSAAPHVSGVAALIISYANRSNAILKNSDLINILLNSSDDHYAVNPLYINKLGSGRVNAGNALALTQLLIGDVPNPAAFSTAPAGYNQIDLFWTKNEQNDDVMILYAEENSFGQPLAGVSYDPGQVIAGGGSIIYKGNGNNFQHNNLTSGKVYYYKIFSVTPENQYSHGLWLDETTECEDYTLPFVEDFGSGTAGMVCWEIIDHIHNGRQAWQIGSMMPPFYGANGDYAFINSGAYGYGYNQNTDLITPTLNLSGYTNITLSFSHYYRHYANNTASVWYSIDNGESWTLIQQWNSMTANPDLFNHEIPLLDDQSQVKFKWNYTGGFGFSWCIDDIAINGTLNMSLPGDANCDGLIDVLDITCMSNYIIDIAVDPFCFENADLNSDGIVDILDIIAVINIIMGGQKNVHLSSLDAQLIVKNNKLHLASDGTLTALEFELSVKNHNAIELNHTLHGFELHYHFLNDKLKGILYHPENKHFPKGTIELFEVFGEIRPELNSAIGGNINADPVPVQTVFEVNDIFTSYPNPANESFTLLLKMAEELEIDLVLYNVNGKMIETIQQQLQLKQGAHAIDVTVKPTWPPGLYFIKLTTRSSMFPELSGNKQLKIVLL